MMCHHTSRTKHRFLTAALATILLWAFTPETLRGDTGTTFGDRTGEGSTPFTGLAQAPEANLFTGALTTSVNIEVPPGRKNMTPKLSLGYSSTGGSSIFGFGWDLPIGRIERSTKWGVPRCGGPHSDDFVLIMPEGTVELIPESPGSDHYRPKVEEGYLRAQKFEAANRWEVYFGARRN